MNIQPVYQFCRVGKSNYVHLTAHPRRTLCGRPRGDVVVQTWQGIQDIRLQRCLTCADKAYRLSKEGGPR